MVYRYDGTDGISTPPSPGAVGAEVFPTPGNPPTVLPSEIDLYWIYSLCEEIRNVVVAAGFTPTKGLVNQLLGAIHALIATSFPTDFNQIGYLELPNGLIIQWGTAQTASNGMVTVTFPTTFPNHALFGTCGNGASAGALAGYFTGNDTPTLTQMVLAASVATAGVGINWLAIGY